MLTPHQVMERLSEFDTADEVADYLRREGIRGMFGSSCDCPISNLFKKLTGCQDVSTSVKDVWVFGMTFNRAAMDLSYAASEFVREFDRNTYPDLTELPPGFLIEQGNNG